VRLAFQKPVVRIKPANALGRCFYCFVQPTENEGCKNGRHLQSVSSHLAVGRFRSRLRANEPEILHMVMTPKLSGPLKQPWHAVNVVGGPAACPAAERLRHKRFLSDEAPPLPLPACSSPWRCKCIYLHHSDRRAISRRQTDRGWFPSPWIGKERREGLQTRGRRADDRAD
jgi:hypothetical protein